MKNIIIFYILLSICWGYSKIPDSPQNSNTVPEICLPKNARVVDNLMVNFDTLLTIDLIQINDKYEVHYCNCCINRFDIDEEHNLYILSYDRIIKYSGNGECQWVKKFGEKDNPLDMDYIHGNLYVMAGSELLKLSAISGEKIKSTDFSDNRLEYFFSLGGLYFMDNHFFVYRFDQTYEKLNEGTTLKILNLQNEKWLEFTSIPKYLKYIFYNCNSYDDIFFVNLIDHKSRLWVVAQNCINLLYYHFGDMNTNEKVSSSFYNYNKMNNTVGKLNLDFSLNRTISLYHVVPCEDGSFIICTESADEANLPSKIHFLNMKIVANSGRT